MIITNLVINVTRLIAGNRTGTGYIRKTKTLLCVRVGPSFGVRFYPGSTGNFTKVADSSKQLVPFVRPVHAPTVYNPTAFTVYRPYVVGSAVLSYPSRTITSLNTPRPRGQLIHQSCRQRFLKDDKFDKIVDALQDPHATPDHALPRPQFPSTVVYRHIHASVTRSDLLKTPFPNPVFSFTSTPQKVVPPISSVSSTVTPTSTHTFGSSSGSPIPGSGPELLSPSSSSITTCDPLVPSSLSLKSQSGKEYTTKLTLLSTPSSNEITNTELILELKKRELIKDDSDTGINVQIHDLSPFLVGTAKNSIKLTALGQAYVSTIQASNKEQTLPDTPDGTPNPPTTSVAIYNKKVTLSNFMIITPPKRDEELFIETGLHKHLLVVYDTATASYLAIGYLTGKNSGELLSHELLKSFQEKQDKQDDNPIFKTKQKEQHFAKLKNPVVIKKEDVHRVKWDQEYIQQLPGEAREFLNDHWTKIQKQPIEEFNTKGITKEEAIQMCLEHDKTVISKQKHPLTKDQIKQNEQNKLKQKLKELEKKKKLHENNN